VFLNPGESAKFSFTITYEELSYYDDRLHSWVAEPGVFTLNIGTSSRDIRHKAEIEMVK
ncbi:MAG: fibronectin type III-like domain-contianing protein, partial [Spirochaetota bacterium]